MDARLDRQQELPGRRGNCEEGRVEPGERRLAGEDAEVVDDIVDRATRCLGSQGDQRQQPLVRVRLAEQVDRLLGEDMTSEVTAVGLGQVVAKAREDDTVQGAIV